MEKLMIEKEKWKINYTESKNYIEISLQKFNTKNNSNLTLEEFYKQTTLPNFNPNSINLLTKKFLNEFFISEQNSVHWRIIFFYPLFIELSNNFSSKSFSIDNYLEKLRPFFINPIYKTHIKNINEPILILDAMYELTKSNKIIDFFIDISISRIHEFENSLTLPFEEEKKLLIEYWLHLAQTKMPLIVSEILSNLDEFLLSFYVQRIIKNTSRAFFKFENNQPPTAKGPIEPEID